MGLSRVVFPYFSMANRFRCEDKNGFNHSVHSWYPEQWTNALAGEAGEACNIAKKMLRIRQGVRGNKDGDDYESLRLKLARELADVIIYADLAIQSLGMIPEEVIIKTFNDKSKEIGYERAKSLLFDDDA
jgi:NTP pyrophosphatase (non-canonical NTP hydrolase)